MHDTLYDVPKSSGYKLTHVQSLSTRSFSHGRRGLGTDWRPRYTSICQPCSMYTQQCITWSCKLMCNIKKLGWWYLFLWSTCTSCRSVHLNEKHVQTLCISSTLQDHLLLDTLTGPPLDIVGHTHQHPLWTKLPCVENILWSEHSTACSITYHCCHGNYTSIETLPQCQPYTYCVRYSGANSPNVMIVVPDILKYFESGVPLT